jgi:hypothetical protein
LPPDLQTEGPFRSDPIPSSSPAQDKAFSSDERGFRIWLGSQSNLGIEVDDAIEIAGKIDI